MKTIFRDVGLFLHVPAVMAVISLPVCLLAKETYVLVPLLTCAITSLGIGQLLYRLAKSKTSSRTPYSLPSVR